MLSPSTLQHLHAIWEQGAAANAGAIAPASGRFLYQLIRASSARRILEIGTGIGLSCLWLSLATQASQGHVTSLDLDAACQKQALSHLESLGVEGVASLLTVDAGTWLARLETSPVDFLFLDADLASYPQWWPHIQRVLRPGGLVVMDKALSRARECQEFIAQVLATPGYLAETYPIEEGLFVIVKDE
ncbi:O-methyltransferase [Paludibacterium yongneupense]|uniref:O-methyltransferase n=1 Tax=Paludibacterium yongneupense TaxID=400061 RepID=UPI0003F6BD57|nr:class I SAM-dependent methyltransferase [Paludibacterium yongneupense]